MKIFRHIFFLCVAISSVCVASAQKVALKNNLLMDGMAGANIAIEFSTGKKTTLEIPASINLWSFSDDKKFKHFLVQPEFRLWKCQPFAGHFWGIHAHYASFNVGGIGPFTTIKNNRYEGWLAGAGISYGYNWLLSPNWSLEAEVGAGYAYMSYDKFRCGKCAPLSYHKNKHYFGLTRLSIALVFLIK